MRGGFETLREKDRLEEFRAFVVASSSLLSLPLFLVFWIADLLYAPDQKWTFLGLRLLIVPACLGTNYFIKRVTSLRSAQIVTALYILLNSAIITTMVFLTDGAVSPYYAGLNLLSFGIIYFPWNLKFLLLTVTLIYGPFIVGSLVTSTMAQMRTFVVSLFFIVGTVVIASVIRLYMEGLRRRELEAKMQLQAELAQRETIILEKTNESIRLRQLTQQFSPQIVHKIKSGELSLSAGVIRQEICVIFVDVVNSTKRINSISLDSFNKVISGFLKDTVRGLLKYDITIDKFMGDGVLAFSNAPIVRQDYVARVLDAAHGILKRLESEQHRIQPLWGGPLEIRIGIAAGDANVGFYGEEESHKSYTAIGRVVNLAARLVHVGKPNQILVAPDIARKVGCDDFQFKPVSIQALRGFETELSSVFEFQGRKSELVIDNDVELCPKGHGVLHLDTTDKGTYVFICRVCNYVHDGKSVPLQIAA